MCVEYETKRFDICCRVNADEPGEEATAVEYLWAHLSGLIIVAEQFLHTWPGLFYKVSRCRQPTSLSRDVRHFYTRHFRSTDRSLLYLYHKITFKLGPVFSCEIFHFLNY